MVQALKWFQITAVSLILTQTGLGIANLVHHHYVASFIAAACLPIATFTWCIAEWGKQWARR